MVISSDGVFNAGGVSGVSQDLFVFTETGLGETTSGTWAIYFDGSDVGLTTSTENIWGAEVGANGNIYLTTISTYAVTGVSGDSDDFFTCAPGTLGDTTSCTFSLYWDGDSYGVGAEWLDALAISDAALTVTTSSEDRTMPTEAVSQIYLPLIQQ